MASPRSPFAFLTFLFALVSLPERRLSERLKKICSTALSAASSSLNDLAAGDRSQEVATQRFLSNTRVSLRSLRDSLLAFSLHNLKRHGLTSVLVAYDPTLLDFTTHSFKKNRTSLANHDQLGYRWHNALFVDLVSGRLLGCGHTSLITADGPDDASWVDYAPGVEDSALRKALENNNKQQFMIYAQQLDKRAPEDLELVHVADREFDDAFAFRGIAGLSQRSHFVIRSDEQRAIQVAPADWLPAERRKHSKQKWVEGSRRDGLEAIFLDELVTALPLKSYGRLPIDKRGRVCKRRQKPHRWAKLEVGAVSVRLAKKSERGQALKVKEEAIWLNLVVVREKNPPKGKAALSWTLLTDLPIDTEDQIRRIVDSYFKRWRIEEFFRSCKQALKVEDSRLADESSTGRLLWLVLVKLLFLDEVRALADIEAGVAPSTANRSRLKRALERAKRLEGKRRQGQEVGELCERERGRQLLAVLAWQGGWRFMAGESLGNSVLLKGLERLRALVAEGCYAWLPGDV